MPVFVHDVEGVEGWLRARVPYLNPVDCAGVFQVITWTPAFIDSDARVCELKQPEGDDDEAWDEFRAAQAEPLVVALSCAGTTVDGESRPCVVLVHDLQHTFVLEPPGSMPIEEARTFVASRIANRLDFRADVAAVQRLRVSGVERDNTNHRVKDWFIEVRVSTKAQVAAVCRSLPSFSPWHIERSAAKGGGYELPASTVELARAGLRPSAFFRGADIVQDADGILHVSVKGVSVVTGVDEPVMTTMGWDTETTGLSMQYSKIGVVSTAFWTTKRLLGALTIAIAPDTHGLLAEVPRVFPMGMPESHALFIAPSERAALHFFVQTVLPIANTTWGYNSFKFDMPLLMARLRQLCLLPALRSWLPGSGAYFKAKKLESDAYGTNNLTLLHTGGQIHSDLLFDAWKNNNFAPGSQSLNNVLKTVCGISKRAQAYSVIRGLIEHPLRNPRDTMDMWLYGAQDALVLYALNQPKVTAAEVLEPMGIDPSKLYRILTLHTVANVRNFFPVPDACTDVVSYLKEAEGVAVEIDDEEGFVDGWVMLPDGTRIRDELKDGSSVWTQERAGMGDSVWPLAELCMMHPDKVLSYGQQVRMRSLVYTFGVLNGYVFDFDRSNAPVPMYAGGAVEILRSGIFGKGVYADFAAFYPWMMINHILSMEIPEGVSEAALDDDSEWVCNLRAECIIPQIMTRLLSMRRTLEAEMRAATSTTAKKQKKNAIRCVKATINSGYGFFGADTNPFGNGFWKIASNTTRIARREIGYVKQTVEVLTFDFMKADPVLGPIIAQHAPALFALVVVYGDTDSAVFVYNVEKASAVAADVSMDFVADFSEALCHNIPRLSRKLGVGTITGTLDVEILFSQIMGCTQSKTYAAVVQTRQKDGSWITSTRTRGLAIVRKDRIPYVRRQQQLAMDAVQTLTPTGAKDSILASTYAALQLLTEAGGSSIESMSKAAIDLLPFVQSKVCNNLRDVTAQATVARWMEANGESAPAGQKVAFCVTRGSGKVSDRAIPVSRALSKSVPRGLPHDVDSIKKSVLEANSRALAAAMAIPPDQALTVLKQFQPGLRSIGGGEVAPVHQPDMTAELPRRRPAGKVLEVAARSCQKMTLFMEPVGGGKLKRGSKRARPKHEVEDELVNGNIKTFFTKK
jgi:hypothetical protein